VECRLYNIIMPAYVYIVFQLYVHDDRLTVGKLLVEVIKCSRLPNIDGASMVYCSIGVG
jgi:hypothetical protein